MLTPLNHNMNYVYVKITVEQNYFISDKFDIKLIRCFKTSTTNECPSKITMLPQPRNFGQLLLIFYYYKTSTEATEVSYYEYEHTLNIVFNIKKCTANLV